MWNSLHYFWDTSISNLETISNSAVVGALVFTIFTFYITYRGNRKSEQIKRIQEIQRMLSDENHKMTKNLFETANNEITLTSDLEQGFYKSIIDVAEWASFLIMDKEIGKNFEKHLKKQIQDVYETAVTKYPDLINNDDDYRYLKMLISKWKEESKRRDKFTFQMKKKYTNN